MKASAGKGSAYRRDKQAPRYLLLPSLLLIAALLACNAPFANVPTALPQFTAAPTNTPYSGDPPKVTVESPGVNAQAVLNQPFTVRVHATDRVGVTRVEMHESGRIVAVQPSADPSPDLTALLEYRPTQIGNVKLDIVAYRNSVFSDPVTVTVDIVANASLLANPASLDPTRGVAAGAICTTRVNVSGLTLRAGSSPNTRALTILSLGEILNVTGRNADSTWYAVRRSTGASGWVSASYTKPIGDCSAAPITSATVAP